MDESRSITEQRMHQKTQQISAVSKHKSSKFAHTRNSNNNNKKTSTSNLQNKENATYSRNRQSTYGTPNIYVFRGNAGRGRGGRARMRGFPRISFPATGTAAQPSCNQYPNRRGTHRGRERFLQNCQSGIFCTNCLSRNHNHTANECTSTKYCSWSNNTSHNKANCRYKNDK